MSKLEPATLYYGMLDGNFVQVITENDRNDFCLVKTLSGNAFECVIKRESFSLFGHCKITVGPIGSVDASADVVIHIATLREWDANDRLFSEGRNGPLNLPRTL